MDFRQFQESYQKSPVNHYEHTVSNEVLVSVLVQTYNHEKYIAECLDSIIKQETSFNFEIIVGEDDSTDHTRSICFDYARKYPEKIRLILHNSENKIKVNGMATGNFNAFYNFFQARGKYIAFCEGDDYWNDSHKLEKQVNLLMENKDASLCFHCYNEVIDGELQLETILDQPEADISQTDLQRLLFHPQLSTVCFRNKLNIPPEILGVINVDSFLLSLLGHHGFGIFEHGITPNTYRRHSQGIWNNKFQEKKYLLKVNTFMKMSEYYLRIENMGLYKHFSILKRNFCRSLFRYYIRTKPQKAIHWIPKIF